ncbi:MAG: iron complex outerrane recepter protein [Sphingomonadales bacterium]|jgi:iron complex outermembrane receptor protein|nr:iron complex outerrane recepter protein [Sphingomonadales bacterium]
MFIPAPFLISRSLAAIVAVAIASPALAAAETAAPMTADADAAPAADQGLEEIVVTATRRETNLQRTPIAISVLGAEAIADRHVQSLGDLADGSIPGLRVATFEARTSALTIGIRGIVPLDANQPAREQGVGIYVDGVYLGRQHGLGAALLDVERIEVLKGPQGTLFGRNTEGGALSIVTRAPTGEFGFRMRAGLGNEGAYNADAHLDLPALGPLSVKIDGAVQYQGATTVNPLPGSVGWNYFDRRGLQVKARLQPSDRFTADLSADIGRDRNSPFYSQLLNYNPLGLPVGPATGTLPAGTIRPLPPIVEVEGEERMEVADIGVPQEPSVDKTMGAALTLRRDVTPDLQLRSISAYREVEVEQWDNSGGAHRLPVFAPNGNFSRYSLAGLRQHQVSQEFQAVGSLGDSLDYAAGLYYFGEEASDDASTPSTNRWNADGTGYTINDPRPTLRGFRTIDRASRARSRSYAAYGQATWTPSGLDSLHLTLGGRYTHDVKSGRLHIVNNAPSNFTFEQRHDRFNPLATIAWDAAPDIHLYAKYATGYRAGGASSRSLTYRSFGPEDVKSWEVGAKTQLFGRRLRLNLAAYAMDRKGSQIDFSLVTPQPNGSTRNTLETINAPGTTRIGGVELDAVLKLADDLTLTGAYAYTDTRIPDTVNPFKGVVEPVFIVFTPRNATSVAIDYERPLLGGRLRFHLDSSYAQATPTFAESAVRNDSSFLVNGRLALGEIGLGPGAAGLELALWSRNLLDEAHVYRRDPANRAVLGDYGNFNAPRTFGVEGSLKF